MDPLSWQVLTVNGRRYRVPSTSGPPERSAKQAQIACNNSRMYDDGECDQDDGEGDLVREVGGLYLTTISLDPEVYPLLIGKDGWKKKEFEQTTGTQLVIPPRNQPGSEVAVKGQSKQAVENGRFRLETIISDALNGRTLDYTHFVSLPLNSPHTKEAFRKFKDQVLQLPKAGSLGIDASVFVNPDHLHLTLVMLKLYSQELRHKARGVMRERLGPQIRDLMEGAPLRLRLKGLEYMNDDPSAMHVLYLKVDEVGGHRLDSLCTAVVAAFKDAGLLGAGERDRVKLHATLMNTRHRTHKQGDHSARARGALKPPRAPFDGRELLEAYGALDMGEVVVRGLHLSTRGEFDEDGYYHCMEEVPLTGT